jgi:7-carboxy-7-deazaguanine synthase
MSTADILERVGSRRVQNVTVTGGEPLAQPECIPLLSLLCDHGYRVSLETSGAMAVDEVDERVSIVVDLKTPGSGEVSRNLYENLGKLKDNDQVKFVICNRGDYEWARDRVEEFNLEQSVSEVLFSASHTELSSTELANWILEDQLQVRLQIQLHKILWGDKPGV